MSRMPAHANAGAGAAMPLGQSGGRRWVDWLVRPRDAASSLTPARFTKVAPRRPADHGMLLHWWLTVDRTLLAAMLGLAAIGAILSLAAGPPMAQRLGYSGSHFVLRHMIYLAPAVATMILVSMLPAAVIRRLAVWVLVASLVAMLVTLFVGLEVKGARRWLTLGPINVQPSEFMKPALMVTCAWIFARTASSPGIGGQLMALGLYLTAAVLLVLEPDIGQTVLITAVWGGLFFVAGLPLLLAAAMGLMAIGALVAGYFTVPHVARRIDGFLNPEATETYQVDMAMNAVRNGGLFGLGPGEGRIKNHIPDAHTDFVFAVAAEEYGLLMCFAILLLYGFVVLRGMARAMRQYDYFTQLAVTGLVGIIGLQAAINIGVNLSLLPAKGMTLPLISYGGSSLVAMALSCGMILALTRARSAPHIPETG